MNHRQKIVVIMGSAAALLMLLCPPIYELGFGETQDSPTFYICVLSPDAFTFAYFDTAVDFGRLALELIVNGVVMVGLYICYGRSRPCVMNKEGNPVAFGTETEPPEI